MSALLNYEQRVATLLRELGIATTYGKERNMRLFYEAAELVSVGSDDSGREHKLAPPAAQAWFALRDSADKDGIRLLLISAFRSLDYQRQIFSRKLAAGEPIEQILRVNAAPGYSEHHTGRAVDLTAAGCPPLSEEFEHTPAFAWLTFHAAKFGFALTYSRDNPHGIVYESWHWAYVSTVG